MDKRKFVGWGQGNVMNALPFISSFMMMGYVVVSSMMTELDGEIGRNKMYLVFLWNRGEKKMEWLDKKENARCLQRQAKKGSW
jgi:hypothetical protein